MISAAIAIELRNLVRSPLRLGVLALLLLVGGAVILQGGRDVARWQEAIESGREAGEEVIEEARGYFAAGETGPADRTWVNLTQPRWQDSYAATRIAREPASLAGIAAASPEAGAVTMRSSRTADPMLENGAKLENPALAVVGGLDLVTVFALLLPLLVIALGLEIGGYERARGVLPLVRVQAGHDRRWLWARCVAVGAISSLAGVLLVLLASIVLGAGLADAGPLLVMVLAYVAVWTAILGVVVSIARDPSQGAVCLGAAWIFLCVIIPAIAAERSAALAAEDFGVDLTVEARDAGAALSRLSDEQIFEKLFERFPDLRAVAPEELASGRRIALQGLRIVGVEERLEQRERRNDQFTSLMDRASLASPTIAFTRVLEQLAGRGTEASTRFAREVAQAAARRMESYVRASWVGEPLDVEDFEQLVTDTPAGVLPPPAPWSRTLLTLLVWALGMSGLAWFLSQRRS